MPNIEEKIKARAAEVDESLRRLPELPGHNVQHVVRSCLQEFSNAVRGFLKGGDSSNEFLSSWGQLSADFGYAIQEMKPKFLFTDPSDMAPVVINIDVDSDNDTVVSFSPSTMRKHHTDFSTISPPKRQMLSSDAIGPSRNENSFRPKDEGSESPAMSLSTPSRQIARPKRRLRKTAFDEFLDAGSNFSSIGRVRQIISKHKRPGHPDNVADAAREEICLMSVRKWNGPVERLGDCAFEILRTATMAALNYALGSYQRTDLYCESRRHIRKFLQMHQAEQRTALRSFYDVENYKLFTLNDDAFARYKAEELQLLQARRRERRVKCHIEKQDKKARMEGKPLSETKRAELAKSTKDEELGPDPFAREIDTAAYVRGYYKTAGHRFADNLCQNIQGMLFRRVSEEIMNLLEGSLGLNEGDGKSCFLTRNDFYLI